MLPSRSCSILTKPSMKCMHADWLSMLCAAFASARTASSICQVGWESTRTDVLLSSVIFQRKLLQ